LACAGLSKGVLVSLKKCFTQEMFRSRNVSLEIT
jgi:hypothetical protein